MTERLTALAPMAHLRLTPFVFDGSGLSRYSLQSSLGTLLSILMLVSGGALVWHHFEGSKKLSVVAINDIFDRAARQTTSRIGELYNPVYALVDLTSRMDVAHATSAQGRRPLLSVFGEALRQNRQLDAIYVGYDNGDLFFLKTMRGRMDVRAEYNAPAQTQFVLQTIVRDPDGDRNTQSWFFDADLNEVGTEDRFSSNYDPRQRPWYREAIQIDSRVSTGLYVFFSSKLLGTTVARRLANGRGVVGADITVAQVSDVLHVDSPTPSTESVVVDERGRVLAYTKPEELAGLVDPAGRAFVRPPQISDLANPLLDQLFSSAERGDASRIELDRRGERWYGSVSKLDLAMRDQLYLATLVPTRELLAPLMQLLRNSGLISLALVISVTVIGLLLSRAISRPVRELAEEARKIGQLELDTPISVHSRIREIDGLATTMSVMKEDIQRFLEVTKALSADKDIDHLLESILSEAQTACRAEFGLILLVSDNDRELEPVLGLNRLTHRSFRRTAEEGMPFRSIPLYDENGQRRMRCLEAEAVFSGKTLVIDSIESHDAHDVSSVIERDQPEMGYACRSLLMVPLKNNQDEVVGLLELTNADESTPALRGRFRPRVVCYVEALASTASVALEKQRLLDSQKELLYSLVRIIAGAIDAKSAYTSGHCQRVPELAKMLADAAHESDDPAFRSFRLGEQDREALHLAAWLHDCGKVTTPEWVVDKATKLETLYNRIHEVRMRFEVLWRDAEIVYHKAVSNGEDEEVCHSRLMREQRRIVEDFEFVARCNVGGEHALSADDVARLRDIGNRTWQRNLDDRLGMSREEAERKRRQSGVSLPTQECLLADKAEHIIPREASDRPWGDNPFGFNMTVPHNEFNFGELYNLTIARGTLTDEERFKINDHIIQTIVMLKNLPFPKGLRHVPDLAGNHHERIDGKGYPRAIDGSGMSVLERIMAVADVFEALTASDRPYKEARTVSEAIEILSRMSDGGHVCPDVFRLLLSSNALERYASTFLPDNQRDTVDPKRFVPPAESESFAVAAK